MTLSPVALQALRTAQSAFTGSEADVYEDALARGMEALDGEGRLVGAFQAQELARLEALGVVDAIAKAVRIADDAVSALCREHEENARLRARLGEVEHLVKQMVEGLNGFDCPPPDEAPLDTVTRWCGYLSEAEERVAELEAQREALSARLRAGQRWRKGRTQPLVSQDYVSQDELRTIFGIPLVAPWDEGDDPCHPCGCPKRFDRHADGCPTLPSRVSAPAEGEHYEHVHHAYRIPHDLPPLDGAL